MGFAGLLVPWPRGVLLSIAALKASISSIGFSIRILFILVSRHRVLRPGPPCAGANWLTFERAVWNDRYNAGNASRSVATVYHAGEGAWTGAPLGEVVRATLPDHHLAHMGQLSRHNDGTMEVVLTVVPDNVESHRYGARGSKLVRILVDTSGAPRTCNLVREPDPAGIPDWQPNIQRPTRHAAMVRPALLWTRGVNSHTLTEAHTNVNQVTTEVWLQR